MKLNFSKSGFTKLSGNGKIEKIGLKKEDMMLQRDYIESI